MRPGGWAGWRAIRASPTLSGLLLLTFVFYRLYGPVEVALPVDVASDLHGSAALVSVASLVGTALGGQLVRVQARRGTAAGQPAGQSAAD